MTKERFFAANAIALITHTIVSTVKLNLSDSTAGLNQGAVADAAGRKSLRRNWFRAWS